MLGNTAFTTVIFGKSCTKLIHICKVLDFLCKQTEPATNGEKSVLMLPWPQFYNVNIKNLILNDRLCMLSVKDLSGVRGWGYLIA